jgi:hypothetical protein
LSAAKCATGRVIVSHLGSRCSFPPWQASPGCSSLRIGKVPAPLAASKGPRGGGQLCRKIHHRIGCCLASFNDSCGRIVCPRDGKGRQQAKSVPRRNCCSRIREQTAKDAQIIFYYRMPQHSLIFLLSGTNGNGQVCTHTAATGQKIQQRMRGKWPQKSACGTTLVEAQSALEQE